MHNRQLSDVTASDKEFTLPLSSPFRDVLEITNV